MTLLNQHFGTGVRSVGGPAAHVGTEVRSVGAPAAHVGTEVRLAGPGHAGDVNGPTGRGPMG